MANTIPQSSAETIESCKARIQSLYETHPRVRLNITLTHTKVVQDAEAIIVGVYRHCFCVEEKSCGTIQRHTFTYADLLTCRISIQPAE